MNIAKALKEKSRTSGRIAKLQKQVQLYNQKNRGELSDFDSLELLTELQTEWAHLINLKSKISTANIPITDKLIKLTEAKAELAFWNVFSNAGPSVAILRTQKHNGREYVEVETIRTSSITSKEVFDHRDRVQKLIEDLQDDIDIFNGTTII